MINVFGHTSPDTDTVTSAIVWAWFLTEHKNETATAYVLGDLNSETAFALERFGVSTPSQLSELAAGDQVAIVDTNNPQELPDTIADARIVEIIDHHKLVGGLTTEEPINITIRPVACTATIIYERMNLPASELPTHISGLMLAAILSDTLGFRSPTTTDTDKAVAEELATALDMSIESFTDELLQAKSDLSSFSDRELVTLDSKKYAVGESNLRVSVLETTDPQTVLDRKDGILAAITSCVAEEDDVDDVLFFIVDILREEATVLTYNDRVKHIVSRSFAVAADSDAATLPGVVSRKKQILPVLTD